MEERLAAVIETVYAGTGRAESWAGTLQAVAEATGAVSGCIVAADATNPRSNVNCFHNIDPDWIEAYNAHYHHYDPSLARMREAPGRVQEDHVTGPRPTSAIGGPRRFYHEVMAPQAFRHTLALGLSRERPWDAGIILQRTAGQGPFPAEARTALATIGGHLRRALQLHARLAQVGGLQSGMAAALDRAPTGVLFLDTAGRTVFVNRRAETLLRDNPALTASANGLRAGHPDDDRQLQALVCDALASALGKASGGGGGHLWLRGPDWQTSLHAEISPLTVPESGDPLAALNAFAAVWLTPRQARVAPAADSLSRLYDLTRAEGELLARLVAGATVAEVAQARAVTLETARSQLKSLMSKLDVSRQTDLVRLVLSGPAVLSDGT
jgi:DNA-binding CsgD family transcriptional regulator/PAS domain-containing protein